MKIKGFEQWLVESRGEYWDEKLWYGPETDLAKLFGNGVLELSWKGPSLDLELINTVVEIIKRNTGSEVRPIMATWGLDEGIRLWVGHQVEAGEGDRLVSGVDQIRSMVDSLKALNVTWEIIMNLNLDSLTTSQLFELLDWLKSRVTTEVFKRIEKQLADSPNWREDRVDWALGDW
jgi:hypothetical protein